MGELTETNKQTQVADKPKKKGIMAYLNEPSVKANIEGVLGKEGALSFITDIVACVQNTPQLAECSNASIVSASLIAKSCNLSLNPSFGHAYLVPYKNKKTITDENNRKITMYVDEAMLNIGWKGYMQLAMRSRLYKKIVASDVRRGELISFNPFINEYDLEPIPFDERNKKDANGNYIVPIIGYYARLETADGFLHEMYMTKEDMLAFAKRYSKAYRTDLEKGWSYSFWTTNFDGMALKTMYRQILGKYGVMTPEMQKVYEADMSIGDNEDDREYSDNTPNEPREVPNPLADVIDVDYAEVDNQDLPDFLKED